MAFDPCREWLGIDAVSLGDPARVLGVADDCRDAAVIGRAAEARLESLRRVTPGPFAKAHAALVARVEEARDALLAASFSTPAPRPTPDGRPSFAPKHNSFAPSAARWAADEDEPATSPTGFSGPGAEADAPLGPAVRRTVVRGRPSSSGAGGLLLTAFALLATAVAVLVFMMIRPDPFAGQVAVKKQPATPAPTREPKAAAGEPQAQTRRPDTSRNDAAQPEMAEPATGGPTPAEAERPDVTRDDPDAERRRKEAAAREQEAERRRMEQEEQAAREAEMAEQKAAAAAREAEEMRRREEMAAKEADERSAQAKATMDQDRAKLQEAVDKALGDAYTALQRGEFDTADRAIAAAGNSVGDDVEAATRIERWRLLATYVREFVGFRDQAYAAANAGREYAVDGKPFAIIEITPDKFVYKLAGKIERASRETVDPRIAMAVVEGWFEADGRAANHLFLGAQWLCLDPPNPARAKAEWRKAGDGGEQVDPLTALLDDPVIRRAGR